MQEENYMGTGFQFTCKKCGKRNSAHLAIGMGMPCKYKETLEEILVGKWGEEYQAIVKDNQLAGPDIQYEMYICSSCGPWKVEKSMKLYVPKNPDVIWNKQYGIMTVCEWGGVPYLMRDDIKQDYRCVKRMVHKCKCGKRMHRASEAELNTLPCQACGTVNGIENHLCWD